MPDRDHEAERALVHDLNNSLAAIVAFSHLIRTDPTLPEGLRHRAEMLVEEADRTRQIVNNLVGGAAAAPTAVEAGAATDETSRPTRIMVLDDEPAIRDFLGRILVRGGYEPVLVSDGPSALEILRTDPPDAILCDHRMAGMTGIDFHEAVAAIDPGLARRFVFMSGDVLNTELRAFALAHGVTLLAKPCDIESVDRTIGGILGPVQPVG